MSRLDEAKYVLGLVNVHRSAEGRRLLLSTSTLYVRLYEVVVSVCKSEGRVEILFSRVGL